jgi:hypothetical protein
MRFVRQMLDGLYHGDSFLLKAKCHEAFALNLLYIEIRVAFFGVSLVG